VSTGLRQVKEILALMSIVSMQRIDATALVGEGTIPFVPPWAKERGT
jgi:hypothetical protein